MSARRARPRPPAEAGPPPAAALAPAAGTPPSRREWTSVLLMAAAYAVVHQMVCVIKFRWYLYRDFDLAIFVQAIHGVMHGQWFNSIRGTNWLGDHSSLILVPLAPLFALAPHATTLLAIQTLALAAGAWPVWALARRELPAGPLPLACVAIYLLHPALGYLNLFEFHPEALAVPFLLWAVLEVRSGRTGRAALAAGIALLAREDVPLPVLGLALVALLQKPRRPRMALALAALALGSLVVSFAWLKPQLLGGQAEYAQMYARWGDTPLAIVKGVLSRPLEALASFWTTPGNPHDALVKKQLWLHLFLPVGGVALLAPLALLPALPVLAEHLLSERVHQHTIAYQYAALSLPFAIAATVAGLRAALRVVEPAAGSAPRAARFAALVLLACALVSQALFGPLAGSGVWQAAERPEANLPDAHHRSMKPYRDRMMARLPKQGGVVAGFEFLPHLATRPGVHSLHHVVTGHYTYSSRPYPEPAGVTALIGDLSSQIRSMGFDTGARMRALIAANGLRPVDAAGGTLLLVAGAADSIELVTFGAEWPNQGLDLVVDEQLLFVNAVRLDSVVAQGGLARVASYWRRVARGNRNYFTQIVLEKDRQVLVQDWARAIGYGIDPPRDWPADTLVREVYPLLIPDDTPPGTYRPLFRLVSVDEGGRQETPIVRFDDRQEPMNVVGLQPIVVTAR